MDRGGDLPIDPRGLSLSESQQIRPAADPRLLAGQPALLGAGYALESTLGAHVPGGRLTGHDQEPVGDSGVITTLFYTPHVHNRVTLRNGTGLQTVTFDQIPISLSGISSDVGVDVYGYLSGNSLAIERIPWPNASGPSPGEGPQLVEGLMCRWGRKDRLYLGSFYTNVSGQTGDHTSTGRYLWNWYWRVPKSISLCLGIGGWSCSSTTWRAVNANNNYRYKIFQGWNTSEMVLVKGSVYASGGSGYACGICLDGTSTPQWEIPLIYNCVSTIAGDYIGPSGPGLHYFQLVEAVLGGTSNAYDWYMSGGNLYIRLGITGWCMA